MSATTEQTARLPKWARTEIEILSRRVAELEAERAAGPEGSNTFRWSGGIDRSNDTPLGRDPVILFDGFEVQLEGDRLKIRSRCSRRSQLVVVPHVTNVIFVRREEWS